MKKAILLVSALGLATIGRSQVLYGLSSDYFSSDPGVLWSIDETSGAATFVNNVTLADSSIVQTSIVGMADLNGTLYACDCFNSSGSIFGSIDPGTGIFTPLGNQNGSPNWWTLAADPTKNTLYTVESDGGQSDVGHLLAVNPLDGTTTDIGQPEDANGNAISFDNIAFDTKNGVLYGLSNGNMYAVDTGTGFSTLIAAGIPGEDNGSDLTYDAVNDTLLLNDGYAQNLYRIDPGTGASVLIGPNGVSNVIDGLAWTPAAAPEPASLAVLGFGAVALLRKRRRSR